MYMGKHFSSGIHTSYTGTKQFGSAFWYNKQRVGLQVNLWAWEIQLMWDW